MVPEVSPHHHGSSSEIQTMWSKRESVFGRTLGSLRSAQHKYGRRCDKKKMTQVSMEIAASACPQAAFDYMAIILVEDKFPDGGNFIWNHQMISKRIKKMTRDQQMAAVAQMAFTVTSLTSDRHPCNLARVAQDLCTKDPVDDPEQRMAQEAEKIIMRIPVRNEMPLPDDLPVKEGMEKLKKLVFRSIPYTKYNLMLFDMFRKNWTKDGKMTHRLYIYNLVARNFHRHSTNCRYIPQIAIPPLQKVELDDFVFDQHTIEGRKRKRGMEHFLEHGAVINNPSVDIENRGAVKRKAKASFLTGDSSLLTRKRLRQSSIQLKSLDGEEIVSMKYCRKPSPSKKLKMIVTTASGTYFVKGPYARKEEIDFQLRIDKEKAAREIIPMGLTYFVDDTGYYLKCEHKDGFVKVIPRMYSSSLLWEMVRVLVFRAVFEVKETTTSKMLVNLETSQVMSIGETKHKRMNPRGQGILHRLFSKMPNEMMKKQLDDIIHERYDDFKKEVSSYGVQAEMIIL